MRVVIRVDAGASLGTGHLSRCLALADQMRSRGANCAFLCRAGELGVPLASRVVASGHTLLPLASEASALTTLQGDEESAAMDAEACFAALDGAEPADWLIVDHYRLDAHWERLMAGAAQRRMAIDDVADRPHDVDLLLDQNFFPDPATRYMGRLADRCRTLFGPRFALLRPEFSALRADALSRPVSRVVQRVLVMFGGADTADAASRTVRALAALDCRAHVDVVAGPAYVPPIQALRDLAGTLRSARLHVAPDNLAQIMANADIAIGSPGVTSYERCCVALPAIAIAVADNQEPLGRSLHAAGVHRYLGRIEALQHAAFEQLLAEALSGQLDLPAMRGAAASICDGEGTTRVCGALENAC